jgi:hypothetical protein
MRAMALFPRFSSPKAYPPQESLTFLHRKRIVELAVKNELPSIPPFRESTRPGSS